MSHRLQWALHCNVLECNQNRGQPFWIVLICFLECEIILKMMTILAGADHCHYGQFATIRP